ncbi:MAG: ABC transporter ATP-binding protein [Chlorobiales bacterium]|jgi:ABC-type multidrug transport system ATPase subunit|nr:ABC transporter ATP-binding protein [Chlorobiales bacterium]
MGVIETVGLTKFYGKKKVVDDLSLSVEAGQIFGFLGPNGSGKTTTIGMLLGIISPTVGEVRIFGSEDLDVARKRIGATLETPNFYPYLSGYDNLRIAAKIKGCDSGQIEKVLRLVGLYDRKNDPVKAYSLGMKQRLSIASTMLSNPDLIILDEPTNGLDPEGIREVREVIKELAAGGKTIFLSSHLLSEVEQVCSHVGVIKQGKLLRQGGIRELVSKNLFAVLRAPNLDELRLAVQDYAYTISIFQKDTYVLVELSDGDLAALNKFLAMKGIYVSHIADRRQSLEEAFLELTQSQ